jgi:hypothetical protein
MLAPSALVMGMGAAETGRMSPQELARVRAGRAALLQQRGVTPMRV